jgi:ascorbate-specific PTS system EIIC-type component UlaA
MIYTFLIGFVVLVGYLIYTQKYYLLTAVVGLVIIGEAAHFLRKSREKVAHKNAPKDASSEYAAEVLKAGESKNKKLLGNKSKNKSLLKSGKSKNKNLLSNKKP